MADERKARFACDACGGEGKRYASRYGGNDPDVWPVGTCEACDGSGDQPCEDCGETIATREYHDPEHPKNVFRVCNACFDEWIKEDMAP